MKRSILLRRKTAKLLKAVPLLAALTIGTTCFTQISQTVHFSNPEGKSELTPKLLMDQYLSAESHAKITGFQVKITDINGRQKKMAKEGDLIQAFCFEENQCALRSKVLSIQEGITAKDLHVIVLSWWNFGWLQAADKNDLNGPMGNVESTLVLTFRDTKDGAQIELNQINVPNYKVQIPSPDGSIETGPLSEIVNTHWNTLYWDNFRNYLSTL